MIRFAPPVGSTQKYRFVSAMTQGMGGPGPASSMTSSTTMTIKILSRKGSQTTIESTTGQMKVDMPANSPAVGMKKQIEAAGSGTKVLTVMDATAAVVSVRPVGKSSGATAGMGQGLAGATQGVSFPNRPVRVGESWKTSLDMGKFLRASGAVAALPKGMTISGVIPITTKLVAVRQQGGKTLANLKFTMVGTMTMGMQGQSFATKMNTHGDTWIEAGTGVTHSMKTVSTSTTSVGGRSMTQKTTTTMKKL